jgi:hypothetical protein
MKYTTIIGELVNGLNVRITQPPGSLVLVELYLVDPVDQRRFTKLDALVDPNDINDLSQTCGKVMTAAYGQAGHDANEWSQVYKAISRFKRKVVEADEPKRKGRQAAPPAGKPEDVRGQLEQDLPPELAAKVQGPNSLF